MSVCLSVGLPVRFVCWSACSGLLFVSLFLCFFSVQRPGLRFFYLLYYYIIPAAGTDSIYRRVVAIERAWRPTTPRRSSKTAPYLPAGTRSRFKNTRASCGSTSRRVLRYTGASLFISNTTPRFGNLRALPHIDLEKKKTPIPRMKASNVSL